MAEPPPPVIRGDGVQHRKRGEPYVRDCQQHDTPQPTWDSKTGKKTERETEREASMTEVSDDKTEETSRTDGMKKSAASLSVKDFFKWFGRKKVDEVLSDDDPQ